MSPLPTAPPGVPQLGPRPAVLSPSVICTLRGSSTQVENHNIPPKQPWAPQPGRTEGRPAEPASGGVMRCEPRARGQGSTETPNTISPLTPSTGCRQETPDEAHSEQPWASGLRGGPGKHRTGLKTGQATCSPRREAPGWFPGQAGGLSARAGAPRARSPPLTWEPTPPRPDNFVGDP